MNFFDAFSNPIFLKSFSLLLKFLAFAVPIGVVFLGWDLWVKHRNAEWLSTIKWIMLEIKVPKDVYKTPRAMEIALGNALFQAGGVGTRYKKYWEGRLLVWFSLEIISVEGEIRFLIRTPKQFRNIIQSQIYAQYPQAEIFEVPDYTLEVIHSMYHEEWGMWGCEHHLKKPDAYPIRTYSDFGLDKPTTKAEEEAGLLDPLVPQLEWMGTMGKGEHFWMQILVRATKDSYYNPYSFIPKKEDWKDKAKREMEKIKAKYDGTDAIDKLGKALKMTKSEQEVINAIERSLDKPAFDVGIRTLYLAKKPNFKPEHITGLTSIMRPYGSNNLNSFTIANATDFDNPWEDMNGDERVAMKLSMLNSYVERGYFYPPHKGKYYVLTAEELATIYHFPGRVASTPTFKRIDSKKSEPPVNLPL
jgi:hypothetical protein